MNKSDFNYDLPQELIAQHPASPRDSSRLLVYDRGDKSITHRIFHDIVDYFNNGDVLVVNNTKVLPARLYGYKSDTAAKIEILLHKRINLNEWEVLAKPQKRIKAGSLLIFNDELKCEVLKLEDMGITTVKFIFDGVFEDILSRVGEMPLPHYIRAKLEDKERYQTVYAKVDGSAAAPTAGLHFTPQLMDALRAKGVIITEVLLHVGLGTFRPVKSDDILDHKMHSEFYSISKDTADIINSAVKDSRRVIAVGTTSVRVLETCADEHGYIKECSGYTDIFIYPSYKFKLVKALITNFHLPESTLIMLVSAFMGREEALQMYCTAVEQKYRFFSFGDATLIL